MSHHHRQMLAGRRLGAKSKQLRHDAHAVCRTRHTRAGWSREWVGVAEGHLSASPRFTRPRQIWGGNVPRATAAAAATSAQMQPSSSSSLSAAASSSAASSSAAFASAARRRRSERQAQARSVRRDIEASASTRAACAQILGAIFRQPSVHTRSRAVNSASCSCCFVSTPLPPARQPSQRAAEATAGGGGREAAEEEAAAEEEELPLGFIRADVAAPAAAVR